MKSDEILEEVLKKTGLPVKEYEYKGTKTEYIIYNEEDERNTGHADDMPGCISLWWQVHLFTPAVYEYRKKKREIRKLLLENGFTLGQTKTLYEQETETMHVVISCHTIENMEV